MPQGFDDYLALLEQDAAQYFNGAHGDITKRQALGAALHTVYHPTKADYEVMLAWVNMLEHVLQSEQDGCDTTCLEDRVIAGRA